MLKTLYQQIKQYRTAALLTPAFTALEVLMDVLIPYVTASLIDKGINAGDMENVYFYGAIMLGMAFLSLAFGIIGGRFSAYASTGFAANLRLAMYQNIQRKDVLLKDGTLTLKGKMTKPGFYRVDVTAYVDGKEYKGACGAAFSPEKIYPTTVMPKNFSTYWQKAIEQARQTDLMPTKRLLPERCTKDVNVYEVSFQNMQWNWRTYGILCEPVKPGKYPALLRVPGAGVRPYAGDVWTASQGVITLEIGIHGIPVTMDQKVYDDIFNGALMNYWNYGNDNRDESYYKRVVLGEKTLAAGKVYNVNRAATDFTPLTVTDNATSKIVEPENGSYSFKDGSANITVTGLGEGETIRLNDNNNTVILSGVTATSYDTFIYDDGYAGTLNIVLNGTNSITITDPMDGYRAIRAEGALKLSGNGTLTVTVTKADFYGLYGRSNYASFGGDPNNPDTNVDASVLAADGFTVTRSDRTDNGDGTYTWTYTVALSK